ncbi:MAG: hypothetical protein ACW99Q_14510 [Candidatus Kariarchaeaceae archaeon]|jgi:hypothetical protein
MDRSYLQEQISSLYLRLNGCFVSGFIVHAPIGELNDQNELRTNRTEIDLLAVRFPNNREPEREIEPSPFLQVSSELIDILIGEVKGGNKKAPQFNKELRENPESIKSLFRWIGIFTDEEIDELIDPLMSMFGTQSPYDHENYRQLMASSQLVPKKVRIRTIFFAPDRPMSSKGQTKYIYGEEIINYIWTCLRPDHPRQECETRYDFTRWGTYEPIIRFFKKANNKPSSIQEVYDAFEIILIS